MLRKPYKILKESRVWLKTEHGFHKCWKKRSKSKPCTPSCPLIIAKIANLMLRMPLSPSIPMIAHKKWEAEVEKAINTIVINNKWTRNAIMMIGKIWLMWKNSWIQNTFKLLIKWMTHTRTWIDQLYSIMTSFAKSRF